MTEGGEGGGDRIIGKISDVVYGRPLIIISSRNKPNSANSGFESLKSIDIIT